MKNLLTFYDHDMVFKVKQKVWYWEYRTFCYYRK